MSEDENDVATLLRVYNKLRERFADKEYPDTRFDPMFRAGYFHGIDKAVDDVLSMGLGLSATPSGGDAETEKRG